MKVFFALFFIMLLLGEAMASSRVDSVLADDTYSSLQDIVRKKKDVADVKATLSLLSNQLKKVKKGQVTYINIRNVSGSLAIVAIAAGAYTARFPKGIRLTGLKLMLGSYLAVTTYGESMVKLNQAEVEDLSSEIMLNLAKISRLEKTLIRQTVTLCAEDPRHELCYK